MAMTYKQAIDLTNKCGNNWKFDIFNYAVWKAKSFEKIIPIKDNMVIICKLDFRDVTENYKKIGVVPYLTLTRGIQTEKVIKSSGWYYCSDLGEYMARKNTNVLIKYTHEFTDKKIFELTKQRFLEAFGEKQSQSVLENYFTEKQIELWNILD